MGSHTFDPSRADKLERPERRFRFLSVEELCWALNLSPDDVVADLGSGTGFFTDLVAEHAETVYAVDLQPEMHDYYREKGVPENVALVTSDVSQIPIKSGTVDVAYSIMTYHEFASEESLAAIRRILAPSGRLVIVDWSAEGSGEEGPPVDERFTVGEATDALEGDGFSVKHAFERPETFLLIATVE